VALKRLREPKVLASLMAALIVIVFLRSRRGRP
jgi:hypothetical protein